MYFYELHEGDNDVFADLLLARDEEMEPEVFFETVQAVREQVIGSFGHDTLIEAIADELERNHGFIFISDDRLTAAVNVSRDPKENFLADLEAEDVADEVEEEEFGDADFRSIVADFKAKPPRPN